MIRADSRASGTVLVRGTSRLVLGVFGCLVAAGLSLIQIVQAADAEDMSRAASLVNSFQAMCTIEPIDFARLDQKAAAMRLPVNKDIKSPPNPNGYFVESKSWLLPLKTGPHELVATQGVGPRGKIKGCGIGAPDVEASKFSAELIETLHLGKPTSESGPSDAMHKRTWSYGGGMLMLVDGGQARPNGIYLFLNE